MMRLIDADALIDEIKHTLWDWESVDGIMSSTVLKQTISDINNMPTIDAVEVVRCKDCKYYEGKNTYCANDILATPYDYCSRGERREE